MQQMGESLITFRLKRLIVLVLCIYLAVQIAGCTNSLQPSDILAINRRIEDEAQILMVGDTIAVKFFYNGGLNDEVTIRPDGKISLQLIGDVQAAGLTPDQLASLLTRECSEILYVGRTTATGEKPATDALRGSLNSESNQGFSENSYVLGVGSTIAVKFFYSDELNDEVTIRPDGKISLQLIGEAQAAGLTPAQMESLLIRKYSQALYDSSLTSARLASADSDFLPGKVDSEVKYILKIGDTVGVRFLDEPELDDEITIRPDGRITLERIGDVRAAGLTPSQLSSIIMRKYSKVLYPGNVHTTGRQAVQLDPINLLPEFQYVLSVGSTIDIKFFYNSELNDTVTIGPDGNISLQLVGEVKAAGLSSAQLDALLTEKYSEFLESPEVAVIVRDFVLPEVAVTVKDFKIAELTVIVKDFKLPEATVVVKSSASQKVYVGGEIARPGMIPISGMLRVLDAVIQSGGPLSTAELENVVLIRYTGLQGPDIYALNLKKVMKGESPDIILKPYDVIYLPRTAIAEVSLLAKEYIHNLIPVQFNIIYNLNPNDEVRIR